MSDAPEELPPNLTVANRAAVYLRSGGFIAPLITVLVAFIAGGLVVLITGHNPIETYSAIFKGTGFNWIFPWLSEEDRILVIYAGRIVGELPPTASDEELGLLMTGGTAAPAA